MSADLRAAVDSVAWYHTMDLSEDVTTRGWYDLRSVASKVLPEDLTGKRCLDAATASGFWAFEMERRGASEVVAIDLPSPDERDWQLPWRAPTDGTTMAPSFAIAKEALGSSVQHALCSLYDASPERLGRFDFVFIGSVLLHLRDPVRALRALRTVTDGTLRSYEVRLFWASLLHRRRPIAHLARQDDSRWWTPNAAAHHRWMVAAGFDVVDTSDLTFQPFGRLVKDRSRPRDYLSPSRLPQLLGENLFGVPSAWLDGRPAI